MHQNTHRKKNNTGLKLYICCKMYIKLVQHICYNLFAQGDTSFCCQILHKTKEILNYGLMIDELKNVLKLK